VEGRPVRRPQRRASSACGRRSPEAPRRAQSFAHARAHGVRRARLHRRGHPPWPIPAPCPRSTPSPRPPQLHPTMAPATRARAQTRPRTKRELRRPGRRGAPPRPAARGGIELCHPDELVSLCHDCHVREHTRGGGASVTAELRTAVPARARQSQGPREEEAAVARLTLGFRAETDESVPGGCGDHPLAHGGRRDGGGVRHVAEPRHRRAEGGRCRHPQPAGRPRGDRVRGGRGVGPAGRPQLGGQAAWQARRPAYEQARPRVAERFHQGRARGGAGTQCRPDRSGRPHRRRPGRQGGRRRQVALGPRS
jgi:hypothetical protein